MLTGGKRKTKKPTSFMMTTKFAGIMVITMGKNRQLARPLKDFQREYLQAMGGNTRSIHSTVGCRLLVLETLQSDKKMPKQR